MSWARHSLGVSLSGDILEMLYLRATWRGAEVVDCSAVPFHPLDEEGAFVHEVQTFLLRNAIGPADEVVFGVPRRDLFFREITTPPVKDKDLAELVEYESERHLPGKKDDFVTAFQRIDKARDGGHRLLLGAVKKEPLDRYLALLRRANLQPTSIQPLPMGMAAAFRHWHPDSSPALLLSLASASLTIDYVKDGAVRLSSLSRLKVAEEGTKAGGGESRGRQVPPYLKGGEALADAVAASISQPLFLERLPAGELPPLWIVGQAGRDTPFIEKLKNTLQVPVGVVSAFGGQGEGGSGTGGDLSFACFGLALLGLRGGKGGLELGEEAAEERRERPRFRSTAVLAATLLVLLAMFFGLRSLNYRQQMGRIDRKIASMVEDKAAVESLSREVEQDRARFDFLAETIAKRTRQADLLRELTVLVPEDAHLTNYTYVNGTVEITGLAPSASRLLSILDASPLFSEAEFSSAIVARGKDRELFKIKMQLQEEGG